MKKMIFFLFIGFISLHGNIYAQAKPSPAILELRALVQSAKTGFKDDTGELLKEDKENKINYYKTKKETTAAQTFIFKTMGTDAAPVYVITYHVKGMDAMMMGLVFKIVDQYIDELNLMVQSGDYTGRDYTDDQGMAITEMKDKKGNHILDYGSDKETQNIYIFGLK